MSTTTIKIDLVPITDTSGNLTFTFASGVVATVPCSLQAGNAGTPIQPEGVVMTGAD